MVPTAAHALWGPVTIGWTNPGTQVAAIAEAQVQAVLNLLAVLKAQS